MIEVVQIPALTDNYIYLIHSQSTGQTAMVDAPLAAPVLEELDKRNWQLDVILNTHHHDDHVGANEDLKAATGCHIIGYVDDAKRIPLIDQTVEDNQELEVCGSKVQVMFVPGHTLGHIAYYFVDEGMLFCGDTLFAMGCGRLFEGSPQQMFGSLQRFAALPPKTIVYCAHEYTQANGEFALTIEPENAALLQRMEVVIEKRQSSEPTIPTTIALELDTNPFIRATNVQQFAEVRSLKDRF